MMTMLPDLIPRPHPGPDEVPYCACRAEPVAGEHQKQAENAYARHNKLVPWRRPLPTDSSKLLGRLVTLQTTQCDRIRAHKRQIHSSEQPSSKMKPCAITDE